MKKTDRISAGKRAQEQSTPEGRSKVRRHYLSWNTGKPHKQQGTFTLPTDLKKKHTDPLASVQHNDNFLYKNILENIVHAFLLFEDDTLVEANKAACYMFGYTSCELNGMPQPELITHIIGVPETFSNEPHAGEATGIKKTGERFFCNYSCTNYIDTSGAIKRSFILTNTNDIKQLEASAQIDRQDIKTIVDNMDQAFFIIDKTYHIKRFSNTAAMDIMAFSGKELVAGSYIFEYIKPERIAPLKVILEEVFAGATKEYTIPAEDIQKQVRYTELKYIPIKDDNGNVVSVMINSKNVSKEIHLVEDLEESENKFMCAFLHSAFGMTMSTTDGKLVEVNESFCTITGYTKTELMNLTFMDITHPDDVASDILHLKKLLKGEMAEYHVDKRYIRKNGTVAWVTLGVSLVRDIHGNPIHLVGQTQDITRKKEMEATLEDIYTQQQRIITEATIKGQENERAELGRELHDNINQILTSSKLYLDYSLSKPIIPLEKLEQSRDLLKKAIEEIRRLSKSILPPCLDEFGLIVSMEELLDTVSFTKDFTTGKDWDGFEEQMLKNDQKLTIYRIVQEQLNNIIKHADASHIHITLRHIKEDSSQNVELIVQDDGKGFNIKQKRSGVGLRNITSRVELFGGNVSISSAPGRGCMVKALFHVSAA